MIDRYAVMGNPVAQSKSPEIHKAFAEQTQQSLSYNKQLVAIDQFKQQVEAFFAEGGKGLNITLPFKLQAWQLAQERSERAQHAGSANTLMIAEDGKIYADNTDGAGMIRDILQNHHGSFADKRVLVMGAGGAVRGVLSSVLAENPEQLVLANRTINKAEQLAELFSAEGNIIASGYEQLAKEQFDWVINGTAASLKGEMPPLPEDLLNKGAWCYDMMYSRVDTVFLQWAKQRGARKVIDGLGMLVEQAAESFYLWRGVRPQTKKIIDQIRSQL